MMGNTAVFWVAILVLLLLLGVQGGADQRPGKHTHADKAPHGKTAGDQGHPTDGTHQHPWWEPPPADYANARSTRWDDAAAVARGAQLYQTYCLMCHGADGKGTGPAGKGLSVGGGCHQDQDGRENGGAHQVVTLFILVDHAVRLTPKGPGGNV